MVITIVHRERSNTLGIIFPSRIAVNLDFLLVLERTFSSNLHKFQFCPQAAGACREIK